MKRRWHYDDDGLVAKCKFPALHPDKRSRSRAARLADRRMSAQSGRQSTTILRVRDVHVDMFNLQRRIICSTAQDSTSGPTHMIKTRIRATKADET